MLPIMLAAAGSMGMRPELIKAPLPDPSRINWKWTNQRQVRKNRRRAQAAGFKNPHSRTVACRWIGWQSKYRPHVGKKQLAKAAARSQS